MTSLRLLPFCVLPLLSSYLSLFISFPSSCFLHFLTPFHVLFSLSSILLIASSLSYVIFLIRHLSYNFLHSHFRPKFSSFSCFSFSSKFPCFSSVLTYHIYLIPSFFSFFLISHILLTLPSFSPFLTSHPHPPFPSLPLLNSHSHFLFKVNKARLV